MDSTTFCVLEKKNFRQFSDFFSFLPYFIIWRVYCILTVIARHWYFSMSYLNPHVFFFVFFYKKQTAPMSTPNS